MFAELAYRLVAPHGRVGLLVPSGIASDMTTKNFFAAVAESNRLIRLYDFENRLKTFFPKSTAASSSASSISAVNKPAASKADFVFFAHRVEELEDRKRHIALSAADIRLLNPNTRTCPIFRTRRDAEITKAIYRRVPVLIDANREGPTGNPWGIQFKTMFDQTNDAELFREAETLKARRFQAQRQSLDQRQANVFCRFTKPRCFRRTTTAPRRRADQSNWIRQGQTEETSWPAIIRTRNIWRAHASGSPRAVSRDNRRPAALSCVSRT